MAEKQKKSHMWIIWLLVIVIGMLIAYETFFTADPNVEKQNQKIDEMNSIAQQMDLEVTRMNTAQELGQSDTLKNSLTEYVVLLEQYDQLAQEYVELANKDGTLNEQESNNIKAFQSFEQGALDNIKTVKNNIQTTEQTESLNNLLSSLVLGLI
jgi:ABC-type transporter Mla maintaining outer membrane lipid asymmetry ATPase subunit MlaF